MSTRKKRCWLVAVVATAAIVTLGCAGEYREPATLAEVGISHDPAGREEQPAEEVRASAPEQVAVQDEYQEADPSALAEFQEELAPYGAWVDDPTYGTIWVPDASVVGDDFAPYVTGGQWAMTGEGDWLWESSYPFGWATFHYGRWLWAPGLGWSWVAGRRYSNAWVAWRTGYDGYGYVGWAPMAPWYYWRGGMAYRFGHGFPTPYVFCPSEHVFGPGMREHMVGGAQARGVAERTHPYTPANPSRGSENGGHKFASPTRGPTLAEANIPADSAPHATASPNPKAWALARPVRAASGTASARAAGSSGAIGSRAPREMSMTRGASARFRSQGSSYASSAMGNRPVAIRGASTPIYRSAVHVSLPSAPGASYGHPGYAYSAMPSRGFAARGPTSLGASPYHGGSPMHAMGAPSSMQHSSSQMHSSAPPPSSFHSGSQMHMSTPSASSFNGGSPMHMSSPQSSFHATSQPHTSYGGGFSSGGHVGGGGQGRTGGGGGHHR